jgi:hypothetical protein
LSVLAGLLQAVVVPKSLPTATAATAVTVATQRLLYGNGAMLSWSRS